MMAESRGMDLESLVLVLTISNHEKSVITVGPVLYLSAESHCPAPRRLVS